MNNNTNDQKTSPDTNPSGKGVWFYLKVKGLFLIVSVLLIGITWLLYSIVGWEESLEFLENANETELMIDAVCVLIIFLILFGNDLSLPLTIGFTALALVPISFIMLPKFLRGTLHLGLVLGLVIIEVLAVIISFQIKIWIWEEEEIQPPF